MATARDRFGAFAPSGPSLSELQGYIQRACDPVNYEPNLALNFQIADLINQKKGNAPREAAVAIVNYINHRNPNVSMLALALLDICVKNCGYPFHLQISTKEFLNELVRRFPERPPPRPSRVQQRILQFIEEWRSTICQTSKHKEDLGFIRDMHRLLSYKGYTFPQVRREDVAVLNPEEDSLKSAEEMEEEERAAQQAKLQELIRRGTPQDLQEANHLMKVLAGYDQHKVDYRAKAAEEITKLKQKAKLLDEMLLSIEKGDKVGDQDLFEYLADSLRKAQPKIRKIIQEESDDEEAVVKLLELNDHINLALERFALIKKGEIDAAKKLQKPSSATIQPGEASKPAAGKELSLIDLEDEPSSSAAPAAGSSTGNGLEDDLLGLSFQDNNSSYGQGGGIALGFGANTGIPGPPLLSSTIQSSTAGVQLQSTAPSSSRSTPAPGQVNYNITPGATSTTPNPPFPTFTPPVSRPAPQSFVSSQSIPTPQPAPAAAADDDDEWNFASALPGSQPVTTPPQITLHANQVEICISPMRPQSDGPIQATVTFSNLTTQLVHDLTFLLAVPKAYSLEMQPQSGRALQPSQRNGITQRFAIHGAPPGKGGDVKLKWKVSYKVGITGALVENMGTLERLPVV